MAEFDTNIDGNVYRDFGGYSYETKKFKHSTHAQKTPYPHNHGDICPYQTPNVYQCDFILSRFDVE
jgi:hypothetical protein